MEFSVKTSARNQLIDITQQVQDLVIKSGINNGLCNIYTVHTTAAITINENADENVKKDLLNALDKLVPDIRFAHSEGNSDAHLKSSLVGVSKTVPFKDGKLQLGTWQGIMFCEFDGPRARRIIVALVSSA